MKEDQILRSLAIVELLGGPGSGCSGPNCGRPAGHGGDHGAGPPAGAKAIKDQPGFYTKPGTHYMGSAEIMPGKKAQSIEIYHNDKHIGTIENSQGSKEYTSGNRSYVTSRVDQEKWSTTIKAGNHNAPDDKYATHHDVPRGNKDYKYDTPQDSKSKAIGNLIRDYERYHREKAK